MSKKITVQVGAVIKGILFIGFSIQIILGIVWMCCNFLHIQDFSAPDTTLYGGLFRLLGELAPVMYLLQLAAAFAAGYFLLQSLAPAGKWLATWRALALLTFPFAMQCHLALQPHSFVGTLFLLMFAVIARCAKSKRGWWFGLVCAVLLVAMTGVADRDSREELSSKGIAGLMACRTAWSTVRFDYEHWPEELQEITKEVQFDTANYPGNMEVLLDVIRDAVGQEKAQEYYALIAKMGWNDRLPIVIRQVGWDVLGYTFSPIIVQVQLNGDAYDSYTGRNYENMRSYTPRLTKYYVNYSSWWFAVMLVLCVAGSFVLAIQRVSKKNNLNDVQAEKEIFRRSVLVVALCIFISVVWVSVLTLRGAGLMDYKWSIAVNQLWLVWALLTMEKTRKI